MVDFLRNNRYIPADRTLHRKEPLVFMHLLNFLEEEGIVAAQEGISIIETDSVVEEVTGKENLEGIIISAGL